MSNPDRGAYTPPTDQQPLSFDARQPVRGRGPAPMMLFASALVLVVLIVAIVVFYRSGVSQGSSAAPPVVGTPVGKIKGAAPSEAQPADPAAGLQIYQQAEGQAPPSQPNFTAPPETPQVRSAPLPPVVAAPPAPAAPAGPVAALPNSSGLKPTVTATAPPAPAAKAPAPAPVAAKPPPPAPVAAKPAPVAAKPAAVAPKPAPVAAKPAATPPAAPKATAAAPAAPKSAPAAAGAASVQIGAFSSQALADKGWNDAAHIAPGAAAGKGKKVEAIQKGGSTLYRTQVTGFSSRAAAQAFCSQLQAAGKSCFVK